MPNSFILINNCIIFCGFCLQTSNEQLFANLCEKFPLRDASFIQQCLVQAKWNASAANTMIRAGPKTIKDVSAFLIESFNAGCL